MAFLKITIQSLQILYKTQSMYQKSPRQMCICALLAIESILSVENGICLKHRMCEADDVVRLKVFGVSQYRQPRQLLSYSDSFQFQMNYFGKIDCSVSVQRKK